MHKSYTKNCRELMKRSFWVFWQSKSALVEEETKPFQNHFH